MTERAENVDVRILQSQYDNLKVEYHRLKTGDGDGTFNGMNDDWKTSVDGQLTQLHQDVRNLLYGLIASALLALGAGATAYIKLSDQVTDLRVDQAQVAGKIDLLLERTGKVPDPAS